MWEEIGNLFFITFLFVAPPVAVDLVALWLLSHLSTADEIAPRRTMFGYLGLAAQFFAMTIVWGSFYYNVWLFNHDAHDIPADAVAGSARSYDIALILALSSLIFRLIAPKHLRPILVLTSLYAGITLMIVLGSGGVL